ncbi:hypothetical protein PS938_03066 [Pseudomonas fluorescens]|uniref:DUF6708 domain-containing protein n=1 Tax=Pseudomonas fluorescens TaxID=294 RepID=A0A5E7UGA2_PSEFL|nr:DUF6708 domain-containing protein [Pseudomonas fluorescens]VVQ06714.1 hypothetical protein PS938_03066 [Pseudomonas fluorescens]
MFFTEPLLDPPAPGWKRDLPKPNEAPSLKPYPPVLSNSPNHVDHTYLELQRSTVRTRGAGPWLAALFFALSCAPFTIFFPLETWESLSLIVTLTIPILFIIGIWGGVYAWRMDVQAPRDEPIRFNRLRRKVYVYRFHHDGLRPFSRSAWGVRTEVYDWDDLRAEVCSVYGPMGTGGLIESVSIAVVKPGTHQVIDRFHFAHGTMQGEMYWAMAQLFMQQGPQALPQFPHPPRDWNNEDVSFNLARRLAPKVRWPTEIDLESRTVP